VDDDQWDAMYEAKFRERMGINPEKEMPKFMDEPQGSTLQLMETHQGKLMERSHGGIPGVGFAYCIQVLMGMIKAVIYQIEYAEILQIKRMKSREQLVAIIERNRSSGFSWDGSDAPD
jgi:hypothetical protein